TWPQWRYDPANTGLNYRENRLRPIPDNFWFSADISTGALAGTIKTWGPVVADVRATTEIVPDHIVFVGRNDRLFAYRPNIQGSNPTGPINPIQGWPYNLAKVGETNAPDDNASGLIQAPPIYAQVSGLNGAAVETRHVIYVVTGTGKNQDFVY